MRNEGAQRLSGEFATTRLLLCLKLTIQVRHRTFGSFAMLPFDANSAVLNSEYSHAVAGSACGARPA
jgi:hypothetical protein